MHFSTKSGLTIFLIIILLFIPANAWIATLNVLRHPCGHIVRLAGDIHLESFNQDQILDQALLEEEKFFIAIEEPLAHFLSTSAPGHEIFVVEKIGCDLLSIAPIIEEILHGGSDAVSLITRMNLLALPGANASLKSLGATLATIKLEPQIEIIAYDLRSKYPNLLQMSFPSSYKEAELFYQELISHKKAFACDIQCLIENVSIYDSKFIDYLIYKGQILLHELELEIDLEDLFFYNFSDFGYLTLIAQQISKNITLYLGAKHCHNLSKDLEKIGYETIFQSGCFDESSLQEDIIPEACSKEEYQNFFSTY